jgi:hypothetical protein
MVAYVDRAAVELFPKKSCKCADTAPGATIGSTCARCDSSHSTRTDPFEAGTDDGSVCGGATVDGGSFEELTLPAHALRVNAAERSKTARRMSSMIGDRGRRFERRNVHSSVRVCICNTTLRTEREHISSRSCANATQRDRCCARFVTPRQPSTFFLRSDAMAGRKRA